MAQDTTQQTPPLDEARVQQESIKQDELRALQEGTPDTNRAVRESIQPHYPAWPTSKPGPQSTPPPPGMRPMNAIRCEQVVELNYNQETGEPSTQHPLRANPDESLTGPTGFDQQLTAQDILRKRKKRL